MKPTKTQIDNNSRTGAEVAGQNPAMAAAGVEVESATLTRTKAQSQEVDLMEQVLLPANLEKAYARVCANQGSAGVDGIGISEFEAHLRRHWPTVKAKLLAGEYVPAPVRRVDIAKPDGGVRTLGIPTLLDRMIQQALHQVLSEVFEPEFSGLQLWVSAGPQCPIRQWRWRNSMWRPVATGWWTWIWRNSSTGSTTTY